MTRHFRLGLLLMAMAIPLLLLAPALGAHAARPAAHAYATMHVTIQNFAFSPQTITVAPGTTPPVLSVITPLIWPVCCPNAGVAKATAQHRTKSNRRILTPIKRVRRFLSRVLRMLTETYAFVELL